MLQPWLACGPAVDPGGEHALRPAKASLFLEQALQAPFASQPKPLVSPLERGLGAGSPFKPNSNLGVFLQEREKEGLLGPGMGAGRFRMMGAGNGHSDGMDPPPAS